MTSERKAIKAGIGYTIGNYLIKGLSFLTIPIFTRIMSTSNYGIYNTYLSYESIVFIILGLALHSSLKNGKYKFGANFNRYVSTCILIQLFSAGIWLFIANMAYPLYGNHIGYSRFLINMLIIYSLATALIQIYNAYVGLEYRYDSFIRISAFNAIVNISVSIVLILTIFRELTYLGRIIGTVLPAILIGIFIVSNLWKQGKPNLHAGYTKYGISYSLPIIPHGLSQVILGQFDRIMINTMIGSIQSGIYSFAYNINSIIFVTTSSTDQVWGPWFYEKMNAGEEKNIRKNAIYYSVGVAFFVVIVMLLSPELVVILGSNDYHDAVYSIVPIMASGYFSFLYTLPVQVEYYYEKTKMIAFSTICAAVINIVLNVIYIKQFGYVAATYTTLVTYILYFIFHLVMSYRIMRRMLYSLKTIIICSIFVLVFSMITLMLLKSLWMRLIIDIALIIVFCVLINKYIGIKKLMSMVLKKNKK